MPGGFEGVKYYSGMNIPGTWKLIVFVWGAVIFKGTSWSGYIANKLPFPFLGVGAFFLRRASRQHRWEIL